MARHDHFRSRRHHLLIANVPILTKRTAHMKPTSACGPTLCTSSPEMGMHTSVASEATKYEVPKYLPKWCGPWGSVCGSASVSKIAREGQHRAQYCVLTG